MNHVCHFFRVFWTEREWNGILYFAKFYPVFGRKTGRMCTTSSLHFDKHIAKAATMQSNATYKSEENAICNENGSAKRRRRRRRSTACTQRTFFCVRKVKIPISSLSLVVLHFSSSSSSDVVSFLFIQFVQSSRCSFWSRLRVCQCRSRHCVGFWQPMCNISRKNNMFLCECVRHVSWDRQQGNIVNIC